MSGYKRASLVSVTYCFLMRHLFFVFVFVFVLKLWTECDASQYKEGNECKGDFVFKLPNFELDVVVFCHGLECVL